MNDSMKPVLRIAVPLIAGLGALLIGWAVFTNTGKQSAPIPATPPASTTTPAGPAQTPADAPPTSPAPAPDGSTQATAQTAPQPSQPTPAPGPAPTGLRARPVEPYTASTLGSVDESSGQRMRVTLSPVGAGIASIDLADYFETIKRQEHVHAQRTLTETTAQGAQVLVVPFAADVVQVDGQDVALSLDPKTGAPVWREDPPGTFTAIVEDADGAPVLELRRVYTLPQGARSLELRQSVRNLTDRALTIDWRQYGPAELDKETTGYGGDKRRIRFGYLLPATIDPSRQYVSSDDKAFLTSLDSARGPRDKKTKLYDAFRDVWPTERSQSKGYELTWAAMTSRYFAVAVTPLLDPTGTQPRLLPLAGTLRRLALNRTIAHPMVLHLSSGPRQVAPGGVVNLDVAVFAGPQDRDEIRRDPHASASGVAEVIVYNFGGPCGWCTFPIFTHALIALLDALHDYVLFDWALSIMVLVVIVRSILHPVMRWSQIRMQRFGHQMQQMAPKQKKLQEKFKDDPKR
ncbi:MAG: YidC/Oxa1 family insertase periplasmic-domain containing protein, partial [Phycisphaerales bacterium]|nr:YidC/Oxa1 family insertase periplasmic-domain containing protein [Phycisphaerales bacterium]